MNRSMLAVSIIRSPLTGVSKAKVVVVHEQQGNQQESGAKLMSVALKKTAVFSGEDRDEVQHKAINWLLENA